MQDPISYKKYPRDNPIAIKKHNGAIHHLEREQKTVVASRENHEKRGAYPSLGIKYGHGKVYRDVMRVALKRKTDNYRW